MRKPKWFVDLDAFVPRGHLLRQVKAKVDVRFIYDKVRPLYSDRGRPSVHPVMLVKMMLVGYLYGIASERQLEQEITMNLAYRWFLGLQLDQRVPDHSTLSQNRRRRFAGTAVFEKYLRDLDAQMEAENDEHRHNRGGGGGKRGPAPRSGARQRRVAVSLTDPLPLLEPFDARCGPGIVVDAYVTAGNVNDHEPYVERIRWVKERLQLPVATAGADRGYDHPMIHKQLMDLGVTSYISR